MWRGVFKNTDAQIGSEFKAKCPWASVDLTLGARAKQFITLVALESLLLVLVIIARRIPEADRRQHTKFWLLWKNATGQISLGLTEIKQLVTVTWPQFFSVSVMFCKILQFLAHSFFSLSCFCLVPEDKQNWPCQIIQKTQGTGPRKLAEPVAGFQILHFQISELQIRTLSTKEITKKKKMAPSTHTHKNLTTQPCKNG